MQPRHFNYEELTPLEQCIADFLLRQQDTPTRNKKKIRTRELAEV